MKSASVRKRNFNAARGKRKSDAKRYRRAFTRRVLPGKQVRRGSSRFNFDSQSVRSVFFRYAISQQGNSRHRSDSVPSPSAEQGARPGNPVGRDREVIDGGRDMGASILTSPAQGQILHAEMRPCRRHRAGQIPEDVQILQQSPPPTAEAGLRNMGTSKSFP